MGDVNRALCSHTFAQDVCVRGCNPPLSLSPSPWTPHNFSESSKKTHLQLKHHRLLLRHFLHLPLEQTEPLEELDPADNFGRNFFFFSEFFFFFGIICSSPEPKPRANFRTQDAAMDDLKFCFVFSCWLKIALSLFSTETVQAPAPIPKGRQRSKLFLFTFLCCRHRHPHVPTFCAVIAKKFDFQSKLLVQICI